MATTISVSLINATTCFNGLHTVSSCRPPSAIGWMLTSVAPVWCFLWPLIKLRCSCHGFFIEVLKKCYVNVECTVLNKKKLKNKITDQWSGTDDTKKRHSKYSVIIVKWLIYEFDLFHVLSCSRPWLALNFLVWCSLVIIEFFQLSGLGSLVHTLCRNIKSINFKIYVVAWLLCVWKKTRGSLIRFAVGE